jgi:hypothetical protein
MEINIQHMKNGTERLIGPKLLPLGAIGTTPLSMTPGAGIFITDSVKGYI